MSREYTDAEIEAALEGNFPADHPNAPKEPDAPEEEPTPTEEAVEPEAPEAPAPAPDPEPTATEEVPPVEDDWQEKAKKIQAAKDREVAQMQKELQQLREQIAEQRGRDEARRELQSSEQSAQAQAVTAQDLQDGINTNLASTFQWTVAHRPDLVPQLISMVRETEGYGHQTADQMVVEYQEYKDQQRQQELEERFNKLTQEREEAQAPLRAQAAMEDVVAGLTDRFGENFVAAQDEIAKRMETEGRAYIEYLQSEDPDFQVTPELVREMMVDIYLEIREQAMNSQANAPQAPQPAPPAAAALGQSAQSNEPVDDTDEFLAGFVRGAVEADLQIDPSFLP